MRLRECDPFVQTVSEGQLDMKEPRDFSNMRFQIASAGEPLVQLLLEKKTRQDTYKVPHI